MGLSRNPLICLLIDYTKLRLPNLSLANDSTSLRWLFILDMQLLDLPL